MSARTARASSRAAPPMQAALEAQALLFEQHDVAAEVWSATSFQLLRQDALEVERWNRLHPDAEPRVSYVDEQLGGDGRPDRRGHRLHEGRAGSDRTLRPGTLHPARHRRLRTERHPQSRSAVISRWTRAPSRWPCSTGCPSRTASPVMSSPRRSSSTAWTPSSVIHAGAEPAGSTDFGGHCGS